MTHWPRQHSLTTMLLLAASLSGVTGCQLSYVVSQGWRQLALQRAQVPLDSESLRSKLTPDEIEKLSWVPHVLDYCRDELELDPGDAYTTFLDTEGKPISHVVVASHRLALVPYRWHFPIAGDVPYKGYFDVEDADAEATRLRSAGYDVDVIAVGAYSTLGWFRDPVLSTTLELELPDIVDLLIHETVHRTIYFEGETELNEALATHLAAEGTRGFLELHPELEAQREGYERRRTAQAELEDILLRLRDHLDAVYREALTPEQKSQLKLEMFATAERALRRLAPEIPVGALPRSNARVLAVSQYQDLVPAFARLQRSVGGRPADLASYLKEFAASGQPVSVLWMGRGPASDGDTTEDDTTENLTAGDTSSENVAAAPLRAEPSPDETAH